MGTALKVADGPTTPIFCIQRWTNPQDTMDTVRFRTKDLQLDGYFKSLPHSMFTAFRCFTGECVTW